MSEFIKSIAFHKLILFPSSGEQNTTGTYCQCLQFESCSTVRSNRISFLSYLDLLKKEAVRKCSRFSKHERWTKLKTILNERIFLLHNSVPFQLEAFRVSKCVHCDFVSVAGPDVYLLRTYRQPQSMQICCRIPTKSVNIKDTKFMET